MKLVTAKEQEQQERVQRSTAGKPARGCQQVLGMKWRRQRIGDPPVGRGVHTGRQAGQTPDHEPWPRAELPEPLTV